ncbi:MAG: hypothetical protein GY737_11360 [Desulfobacteraceae bacterium]|nr:hypothetical protein [Desulfobacteraceae bacterium]
MAFQDLQDAITAMGALGEKIQGDLIKHEEWNILVSSVKTMADELAAVHNRVEDVEAFIGFEQGAGYTLRGRIEVLEEFVGDAGDSAALDTLSGRVTRLEETDVVEQHELDTFVNEEYQEFKESVQPLRDQYVVKLETIREDYNLGERAVLTATVRTLDGVIPSNPPWVDFITSWGKLKPFDGFDTRSGIDGHSISVRTDSKGIARVRISSEHQQELSEEDEAQVEGFFGSVVKATDQTVQQTLNLAPNAGDGIAIAVYDEMKKVYQRSNMVFMHRFADAYYVGNQVARWKGGINFAGNWKFYRSTVVAIAKEDGDPTTPDSKSAASAIQIAFKDWVGPWIDWYFENDQIEVADIADGLSKRVDPDIYVTLEGMKTTLEDEVQSTYGVIHQNKILNAFGKAVEQIDIPLEPKVAEQTKETVNYGVGNQKAWNVLQYSGAVAGSGGENGVRQPGFTTVMDQAIKMSGLDTLGDDVNVLKGSVTTLEESSFTIGDQVLGTMTDMQNKIVEFNVPQRDILMGNIENIRGQVTEILTKFNNKQDGKG